MGTLLHIYAVCYSCNANYIYSFSKIAKYLGKAAQESFKTWEAEQALLFHGTTSPFGLHTFQPYNEGRQWKEPLRHRLLRMRHFTPSKFGSHPVPLKEHVRFFATSSVVTHKLCSPFVLHTNLHMFANPLWYCRQSSLMKDLR